MTDHLSSPCPIHKKWFFFNISCCFIIIIIKSAFQRATRTPMDLGRADLVLDAEVGLVLQKEADEREEAVDDGHHQHRLAVLVE